MENRTVGFLIIGIAILIGFIVYSFNQALTEIVSMSCVHGEACPMWGTINFQTNISLALMGFVVLIALYLIFFGKEEVELIEPKKLDKENFKKVLSKLKDHEKTVFETIIDSEGTIFQSDLVDKTKFSKVKVTRILDKLEGKGIIERRRRGMTNVVIIKH